MPFSVPPPNSYCTLRLLIILLGLAGALLIVFLISSMTFMLCHGQKEPPEFDVDTFSVSKFTLGFRLFMISQLRLTAWNPNSDYPLSYDHIVASINYKNELLLRTGLEPFSQETNYTTSLLAEFDGGDIVVDKWVMDEINREIEMNGTVGFNFLFVSSIVWGNDSSSADTLRVYCADLFVRIPANGSTGGLTGTPETCRVGVDRDVRNYLTRS